ncbi:hypothetical protein [Nocardioides sp. TF02-7]|nr:hypothetical protein [Nocardioides sp. TF02-7]
MRSTDSRTPRTTSLVSVWNSSAQVIRVIIGSTGIVAAGTRG